MGLDVELSWGELYDEDFPWTIVDGRVYAIGNFIPEHPGGQLIQRAIGEDASELFHTHHAASGRAARVLARYDIGRLRGAPRAMPRVFQRLLNERVAELQKAPACPLAEAVALAMLFLFVCWAFLCYAAGWWRLNVLSAWFWWRHLDSGLHSACHGDFRRWGPLRRILRGVYGVLSHRAVEYYHGQEALRGVGWSKHFWHHVHTNDPQRDPDWSTMTGLAWVRRYPTAEWLPCHQWQCWYWLPANCVVEPTLELFRVAAVCMEALGALLEPPASGDPPGARLARCGALWTEVLLNPGFQGISLLFQPWWRALGAVLLARAVARLVLFPFAEVQHYMPEHFDGLAAGGGTWMQGGERCEEWAVVQLRRTANLRLDWLPLRVLDFLMFHGDSYQIEHHLWPAMSFVRLPQAAAIVREACLQHGVPYHEIGYWEGYARIWQQVRAHALPPGGRRAVAAPCAPAAEDAPRWAKRPRADAPVGGDLPPAGAAGPERGCPGPAEEAAGPAPRRRRLDVARPRVAEG